MEKKKIQLPDSTVWAEETVAWFEAWRDSDITDGWEKLQWQYLFDTAYMHSLAYTTNDMRIMTEVFKRQKEMGLTFEPQNQKRRENIIKVEVTPLGKAKQKRQAASGKPRAKDTG